MKPIGSCSKIHIISLSVGIKIELLKKIRNKYDYKTLMHSSKIGVLEKFVFTQTATGLKLNWNPETTLTINTPVLISIYRKSEQHNLLLLLYGYLKTSKTFHINTNLYQEKFTPIYLKYENYLAKNQLNGLLESEFTESYNNKQAKIRTY